MVHIHQIEEYIKNSSKLDGSIKKSRTNSKYKNWKELSVINEVIDLFYGMTLGDSSCNIIKSSTFKVAHYSPILLGIIHIKSVANAICINRVAIGAISLESI